MHRNSFAWRRIKYKDEEESSHQKQCNGRNVNHARQREGEQRCMPLYELCQPPRSSPPLHYHVDFIETFTVNRDGWTSTWTETGNICCFCQETVQPRISGSHIERDCLFHIIAANILESDFI